MSLIQNIFPFLIIPALFPGIPSFYRFLSLVITGGFVGYSLFMKPNLLYGEWEGIGKSSRWFRHIFFLFPLLQIPGITMLPVFRENLQFTFFLWPVAVWGLLVILCPVNSYRSRFWGIHITTISLWTAFLLLNFYSYCLPDTLFLHEINSFFTFSALPDGKVLICPPPFFLPFLFHSCILMTSVSVFVIAFWNYKTLFSFLKTIPLIVWGIFLFLYESNVAIVLFGFLSIIFLFVCYQSWFLHEPKRFLYLVAILALTGLTPLGGLNWLIYRIPNPVFGMEWQFPLFQPIHLWIGNDSSAFLSTCSFSGFVEILAGILLLTLYIPILLQAIKEDENAPLSAAAIAIFLFSLIFVLPSFLWAITHPLIWLAFVIGIPRNTSAKERSGWDFSWEMVETMGIYSNVPAIHASLLFFLSRLLFLPG